MLSCFFFFNDTATTEIYTLSLHDALPIWSRLVGWSASSLTSVRALRRRHEPSPDRKSTRLNSSHEWISSAGFCLKKKKKRRHKHTPPDVVSSRLGGCAPLVRV